MVKVGEKVRVKSSLSYKSWYREEWYVVNSINKSGANTTLVLNRPLPNGSRVIWYGYVETLKDIRLQKSIEINND